MGIGAEQAEEVRREGRNFRMAMQISIAKKPNRGKSKAASKAMQEGAGQSTARGSSSTDNIVKAPSPSSSSSSWCSSPALGQALRILSLVAL